MLGKEGENVEGFGFFCGFCGGGFFPDGSFGAYLNWKIKSDPTVPVPEIDLSKRVIGVSEITEKEIECPACRQKMKKVNYKNDSNIIMDRCENCNSMWVKKDRLMPAASFFKGNPLMREMAESFGAEVASNTRARSELDNFRKKSWNPLLCFLVPSFIPLREVERGNRFTKACTSIIVINILVFFMQVFGVDNAIDMIRHFAFIPQRVLEGSSVYTVFTSLFVHKNLSHIIGNLWMLYIFGNNLETKLGALRFIMFYLLFGVTANAVSYLFTSNDNLLHFGASGAIAGVMGAYFIFFPKNRIYTHFFGKTFSIPAYYFLVIWIIYQVVFAVADTGGGIDWLAHVGGFFTGVITALVIKKKFPNKLGTN